MQNNKKQNSDNYLDYIPKHSNKYQSKIDEEGKVTILVENTGIFNSLAQKLLKKPRVSQVHLDAMGNFIWPLINGENTVYDIAICVKEEFGEKAEPLYNRLIQYLKTMEDYGFIDIIKSNSNKQI